MWISIKSHDFVCGAAKDFPPAITPPPRHGHRPPPALMFHHFPKYDDPAVDSQHLSDELRWDALFGIPQIGCESIIAASRSNEELLTRTEMVAAAETTTTTTHLDDFAFFGGTDYGDITAGIHI